jgi:hypothetical protein
VSTLGISAVLCRARDGARRARYGRSTRDRARPFLGGKLQPADCEYCTNGYTWRRSQDPVAVRHRCPKYRVRECCLTMYRTSPLEFRAARRMPRCRRGMAALGALLAGFSGGRLGDVNRRRPGAYSEEIAAEAKHCRHPAEDVESYVHGQRRKWRPTKHFGRAKSREFCALPRGRAYWTKRLRRGRGRFEPVVRNGGG